MPKKGFFRTFEMLLVVYLFIIFVHEINVITNDQVDYKDFLLNEYSNDIYKIEQSCILLNKTCEFNYSLYYPLNNSSDYCQYRYVITPIKEKIIKICI